MMRTTQIPPSYSHYEKGIGYMTSGGDYIYTHTHNYGTDISKVSTYVNPLYTGLAYLNFDKLDDLYFTGMQIKRYWSHSMNDDCITYGNYVTGGDLQNYFLLSVGYTGSNLSIKALKDHATGVSSLPVCIDTVNNLVFCDEDGYTGIGYGSSHFTSYHYTGGSFLPNAYSSTTGLNYNMVTPCFLDNKIYTMGYLYTGIVKSPGNRVKYFWSITGYTGGNFVPHSMQTAPYTNGFEFYPGVYTDNSYVYYVESGFDTGGMFAESKLIVADKDFNTIDTIWLGTTWATNVILFIFEGDNGYTNIMCTHSQIEFDGTNLRLLSDTLNIGYSFSTYEILSCTDKRSVYSFRTTASATSVTRRIIDYYPISYKFKVTITPDSLG